MKKISELIAVSAVVMTAFAGLQSCVSETPFSASGEGTLRMNAEVRGDITVTTRAAADYDQETLERNLVVYIERNAEGFGVMRKYLGKDKLPSSLTLPVASYVAEAWTGDSASVSWDKKFYRAYQPFEIREGENTALNIKCNIANVIVSVTKASLEAGISDMRVKFWHTRCADLKAEEGQPEPVFNEQFISDEKALYFMMPTVDKVSGAKETELNYEVSGKMPDGSDFSKTGVIENVQSAHRYNVTVSAEKKDPTTGGALIRLEIEDIPVIDSTVDVFPAPVYSVMFGGQEVSIENQLNLTETVYDASVTVTGFGGLRSLKLSFSDNFNGQGLENVSDVNFINPDNAQISAINTLKSKGVEYELKVSQDKVAGSEGEMVNVDDACFIFKKAFFESLVSDNAEYIITLHAVDNKGHSSSATFRFANTDSAIERKAPVGTVDTGKVVDYTAVGARSATLLGEIYSDEAANYGIKYREQGASEWTSVPSAGTRANTTFYVVVNNLNPGTIYEYKAYCDGFEEETPRTFTTESIFLIPNASFEEWGTYSAKTMLGTKTVTLPGLARENGFWESGNEGAATANMTLTDKTEDMKHSGVYGAKLESKSALGLLAAGNIFAGEYVKTDGTNGILNFGRQYNGSHPSKLKVWANYRPGSGVSVKEGNESFVPNGFAGGNDHGQIFVALTTEPVEIRTNPNNRKLFNKDEDVVLGYGEITWTGNFGPDGELQEVEIPIAYNDRAKTVRPTHIVIVVSASKYGDYFSGAAGSIMYLDDFELVYE